MKPSLCSMPSLVCEFWGDHMASAEVGWKGRSGLWVGLVCTERLNDILDKADAGIYEEPDHLELY